LTNFNILLPGIANSEPLSNITGLYTAVQSVHCTSVQSTTEKSRQFTSWRPLPTKQIIFSELTAQRLQTFLTFCMENLNYKNLDLQSKFLFFDF
jgi:hypothetical protein